MKDYSKEESSIKLLFIGDIVGSQGRNALKQMLPSLKHKHNPHFIVVNGENAAGGRGITHSIAQQFFELGVHGITLGNHAWDNKGIFEFIDQEQRLVRPANFPKGAPGQGFTILEANGKQLVIINIQGRTFLPPLDCPFEKVDHILDGLKKQNKCIFVDFHAEATSEKIAMGWHLDGKVSAMVGTHTHVQTHDEVILPQGTAYVTDVGMVGSREGILGVEREPVMYKFQTQLPARFTPCDGKWFFHAVLIEIDESDGTSKSIQLIRNNEEDLLFE